MHSPPAVVDTGRTPGPPQALSAVLRQSAASRTLAANCSSSHAARTSYGDGIQLQENEDGDLDGRIRRSTASGNGRSGADLAQVEPGEGTVELTESAAPGNADGPLSIEGVTTTGAP